MRKRVARFLALLALASSVALVLANCAVKTSVSLTDQSESIGPNGGLVTTPNSSLSVPPGALNVQETITVQEVSSVPGLTQGVQVGQAVLCTPEGLAFASPVTITLAFDAAKLPATATSADIVIYTAPQAGPYEYTPLVTTISSDGKQVVAQATHFSYFVPIVPSAESKDSGAPDSMVVQPIPDANVPDTTPPPPPPPDSGSPDTGSAMDTSTPDSNTTDSGNDTGTTADTGTPADSGSADTGQADTGTADTGTADTGEADTGTTDTGTADTGEADTGTADTGTADTGMLADAPAD